MKVFDYGWDWFRERFPIWIRQIRTIYSREGLTGVVRRVSKKFFRFAVYMESPHRFHKMQFADWRKNIESKYLNKEYMQKLSEGLKNEPKFSIIFPVWNKSSEMISLAVESVLNQHYQNWELCISDGSTKNVEETRALLKKYERKDPERIKVALMEDPPDLNLIENSRDAIELASGEYYVFLDCDDELSQNCLLELAWAILEHGDPAFIYSDFDKISKSGERFDPSFWPDWSPHTILELMYTTHVTCYKKEDFEKVGGLREGTIGAQDWDLVLRIRDTIDWDRIVHIPKILYHWRFYEGSTAMNFSGAKEWVYAAQKDVVSEWIRRNDEDAKVEEQEDDINLRVHFSVKRDERVAIVIPFRDQVSYLKRCLTSIREKTGYGSYSVVLIDNQSKEEETLEYLEEQGKNFDVLHYDRPFRFGALNNWAVKKIEADQIIFLNNDTEIMTEDWIEAMLEYSQRREIGAVGPKLLYPTGRIQHAGIAVGIAGAAAHPYRMLAGDSTGYNGGLVSVRDVLAVTGACMMIKKSLFEKVGGFNERFDPAYQDVDLGIRLYEDGYWNIFTPYATLVHHESVTRFQKEHADVLVEDSEIAKLLQKEWPRYVGRNYSGDPFYNPNFSDGHEDLRLKNTWVSDIWGRKAGLII